MLLPSALSCDIRGPLTRSRFASRLFSTPPPDDSFPAGNGLLGTCRALQSLLNGSPGPSARRAKSERQRLQSPLQLRTPPSSAVTSTTRSTRSARSARTSSPQSKTAPTTPPPRPPRGANKRRRNSNEEAGGISDDDDCDMSTGRRSRDRFSTPKRRKHLPYDLPLGLAPCDFYSLHSPPISQSPPTPIYLPPLPQGGVMEDVKPSQMPSSINPDLILPSIEEEAPDLILPSIEEEAEAQPIEKSDLPAPPLLQDPSDWTAEDDQRLVEMVLDKFKLSRRDWEECAREMGKDNASVGRRWQALVGEGNVGLRRGGRMTRSRIDDSWRGL